MSASTRLTVVSAAAGTGKTTRLVQEYLNLLREGIPPSRIVAITFTRKAAAELVNAVSRSLRSALGEPVPEKFRREFEACYLDRLPADIEQIRAALNELPNAPAGTTDSFVQRLLSEFALEARLPVDDGGGPAWLDLPIGQGDPSAVFEAAAREALDPPDGAVPAAARVVLAQLGMREALERVSETARALPLAPLATAAELAARIVDPVREAFAAAASSAPKLLGGRLVKACAPFHAAVSAWFEAGMPRPAPLELVSWCAGKVESTSAEAVVLRDELARRVLDLGVARVDLAALVPKLQRGFTPDVFQTADALRESLLVLAQDARARMFRLAAETGALDHELLTEAAIALCVREDRSQRLRGRFDALLVDEVQDSSPRQFRLYEALAHLPGDGRTLRVFYVGDARQSIYLFRGAEPAGLGRLVESARAHGIEPEELDRNWRSTPAMVAAQRALFARATGGTADIPGLAGVASIDHVTSSPARAPDELPRPPSPGEPADPHRPPPAPFPEPVVVVTLPEKPPAESGRKRWSPWDHDCAALDVFAERLLHAWDVEGRPQDSAAVLTASWPKAIAARDRLRAILRGRGNAFLDGSRELAGRPVARDLRTIVRALWDGTDDIAWVGLWRHPMVGLSDGALAAFQAGTGLLPAETQARGLSGALQAEALDGDVYPSADVALFERVRRPLRRARRDIGRLPTAEVVERLAAELHWRAILLAGPDGRDAFAELEVVLDWIRQAEADRVDPDAVVSLLDPERGEEAPRVELHRGERAVSCTTIHQAKGLKYHHVHVADIGTSRSGARAQTWSRAEVTLDGRARTLLGVRFDPDGALKPRPDLLHLLADRVAAVRLDEERLRLAYVAITRAVRSVTFALGGGEGIHARLGELWTADPGMPGVRYEKDRSPASVDAARTGYAEAVGRFAVTPVEPSGWSIVPPSRAGDGWKVQDEAALKELVDGIAARCTLRAGGPPLALPTLEGAAAERALDDSAWGTLVHGWLEHGGLRPGADVAQAARYLAQVYGIDDPRLAEWLVGLVRERLETQQPELLATLRGLDPTQLHFELPFAGTSEGPAGAPWFHAGRMDLVVTWPDRRAWVIDFKAGRKSPTAKADVLFAASLPEYGPQLEAYRSALTAAGWTVEKVGLLFVRTGAWVEW